MINKNSTTETKILFAILAQYAFNWAQSGKKEELFDKRILDQNSIKRLPAYERNIMSDLLKLFHFNVREPLKMKEELKKKKPITTNKELFEILFSVFEKRVKRKDVELLKLVIQQLAIQDKNPDTTAEGITSLINTPKVLLFWIITAYKNPKKYGEVDLCKGEFFKVETKFGLREGFLYPDLKVGGYSGFLILRQDISAGGDTKREAKKNIVEAYYTVLENEGNKKRSRKPKGITNSKVSILHNAHRGELKVLRKRRGKKKKKAFSKKKK